MHGECGHCCCYFLASFTPRGEFESKVAFFFLNLPELVFSPLRRFVVFTGLRWSAGVKEFRGRSKRGKLHVFFLPEFPGMCSLLKETGGELV